MVTPRQLWGAVVDRAACSCSLGLTVLRSQEGKNSCDFSFSCFLDFYQDGLRRLSGNEYVLSTKSKFFLFKVLAHIIVTLQ